MYSEFTICTVSLQYVQYKIYPGLLRSLLGENWKWSLLLLARPVTEPSSWRDETRKTSLGHENQNPKWNLGATPHACKGASLEPICKRTAQFLYENFQCYQSVATEGTVLRSCEAESPDNRVNTFPGYLFSPIFKGRRDFSVTEHECSTLNRKFRIRLSSDEILTYIVLVTARKVMWCISGSIKQELAALWPWGLLITWQKWAPGIFHGGKGGRCAGLTNFSSLCAYRHEIWQSGSPIPLEPSAPVQACTGIALLYHYLHYISIVLN